MGTNVYTYLRNPKDIKSAACAKIEELAKDGKFDDLVEYIEITKDELGKNEIHIGKRSGGWQFNFDHNEWKYYDFTKESIMYFLKSCSTIADEYGREYTPEEFWEEFVDSMKNLKPHEEAVQKICGWQRIPDDLGYQFFRYTDFS